MLTPSWKRWTGWTLCVWDRGMGTKAQWRLLTWLKDNLARCPLFSQLIPTGSRMPSGGWTWERLRGWSSVTNSVVQRKQKSVCSQSLSNCCEKKALQTFILQYKELWLYQTNQCTKSSITPTFVKLYQCVREMLIQVYGNFWGCAL